MFAVFFIMGAFMGTLFGALSSFTGFSGYGAYFYFTFGTATGIVVAALLIRMKQKEEQERNAQKLKT